jgi:hypothetical protein
VPTTPTSIINRLMGLEAWTDPIALASGTTVGGQVVGGGTSSLLAIPAATTTLTLAPATHAGKTLLIASTGGLAVTPPAATGTGNEYSFFVTAAITGGNFTLDAKAGNATDVIYGWMQSYKATTFTPYTTGTNTNLITFDGSTMGFAQIGDWFSIRDMATHVWRITGWTVQSGTIASMFSNH